MKKITNPQCWTSEAVAKQMKTMQKWKKYRILKMFIVSIAIISIVGYGAYSGVESGKWEWSVESEGISTTQEEDILNSLNSSAVSALFEWMESLNMTVDFNSSDSEELQQLLNDTLGEGATLEDFFEALQNGTLQETVVTDIVNAWIDSIADQLPPSWYEPLRIIGVYRGSVEIKDVNVSLFLSINGSEAPIISNSDDLLQTNDQFVIEISFGNIVESIVNASKPIFVDVMVDRLLNLNSTEVNASENFFDGFIEQILPQLPLGIGYSMGYKFNLMPFYTESLLDFGEYILGGDEE